jgi:uncharacterized damage-inducible protein DinB
MTAKDAQTLLAYTAWASHKILDAAQRLPPQQLHQPTGISHQSIAGTLNHIYWADRAWFERIADPGAPLPAPTSWEETRQAWPELLGRWQQWAAERADGDFDRAIEYQSLTGGRASTRLDQIVMHVVNHATLHRGQVMGMLRQLGVEPPHTDMIYFFREQAARPKAP